MDPVIKTILTIAVFMVSFVWYFRNLPALNQWFNSKLGLEQPTKKQKANTVTQDDGNTLG